MWFLKFKEACIRICLRCNYKSTIAQSSIAKDTYNPNHYLQVRKVLKTGILVVVFVTVVLVLVAVVLVVVVVTVVLVVVDETIIVLIW